MKDYLRQNKNVSHGQLCENFKSDEGVMEGMLQVWARNWKLETIWLTRLCSGCSEIKFERDLFFYWKLRIF